MSDEIKKGDTVELKSGGPPMTVENVGSYGEIENAAKCVWFDEKNKPMERVFDIAVLKKVDLGNFTGVELI